MPDEKKPERPKPPEKIENPLPDLALAMKSLGSMQVAITKAIDELETRRQVEYIAACKAFDSAIDDKKAKEEEEKKATGLKHLEREVKRLKRKLEQRPAKPDPLTHPMAVPAVISRVLAQHDFDKANLKSFSVICKAWVLPVRAILFKDLNDMQVGSKARCEGLIELLNSRKALCTVVKAINFAFQPDDPSVPKQHALRDALPNPIQWLLLLTMCTDAKTLSFTNMATFGATKIILHSVRHRIEKVVLDPKGYAWHGKEIEFGQDRERAILGDWAKLKEITIARVTLKIWSPRTSSRSSPTMKASCPLTHVRLEKVRLAGYLSHMLQGAAGTLTHLTLIQLGALHLRDLCKVLSKHCRTLTNLVLVGNQLDDESDDDFEDILSDFDDGRDRYESGNHRNSISYTSSAQFDAALASCVHLVSLALEPGALPVKQPGTLFASLSKLEVVELNNKNTDYEVATWVSMLGLVPTLIQHGRKLKSIHFGHDYNSDDRRLRKMRDTWAKHAEKVETGRL